LCGRKESPPGGGSLEVAIDAVSNGRYERADRFVGHGDVSCYGGMCGKIVKNRRVVSLIYIVGGIQAAGGESNMHQDENRLVDKFHSTLHLLETIGSVSYFVKLNFVLSICPDGQVAGFLDGEDLGEEAEFPSN
jgi:hypothetical protein